MNNIELVQQVIIATRNATLAYHNYMYTDKEYVKGQKLYLREMHFLVFVGDNTEMTMSEIAEKMNVTQGAATQIAGRLLKKGLIQKQKHTSDKRYSVISLTPQGTRVYKEYLIYNQARYAEMATYLKNYTKEDMELILKYENLIQEICSGKAPASPN